MRRRGRPSWEIRVDRWNMATDLALWFRAAERIDVRSGGVIPGPLDIDDLPEPSTSPGDISELAEGWEAWWRALLGLPSALPAADLTDWGAGTPVRTPPDLLLVRPPDFAALADWPRLRETVAHRWREAGAWHSERKRAGLAGGIHRGDPGSNRVVRRLEKEQGRTARPFVLEVKVLPVRDAEIRRVEGSRYLIPEGVHSGPDWPARLRDLVAPLV